MLYSFQVYSTAIQLHIHTYMYVCFFRCFSLIGYYKILSAAPCAMQKFLLFTSYIYIYSTVHLLIPNS